MARDHPNMARDHPNMARDHPNMARDHPTMARAPWGMGPLTHPIQSAAPHKHPTLNAPLPPRTSRGSVGAPQPYPYLSVHLACVHTARILPLSCSHPPLVCSQAVEAAAYAVKEALHPPHTVADDPSATATGAAEEEALAGTRNEADPPTASATEHVTDQEKFAEESPLVFLQLKGNHAITSSGGQSGNHAGNHAITPSGGQSAPAFLQMGTTALQPLALAALGSDG
eukprot:1275303-Prymnesium_polylepis.2